VVIAPAAASVRLRLLLTTTPTVDDLDGFAGEAKGLGTDVSAETSVPQTYEIGASQQG
jgi:hypothetical protein